MLSVGKIISVKQYGVYFFYMLYFDNITLKGSQL